jgi:hypothetical protein
MTWDQWAEAAEATAGHGDYRQLLLEWADWCEEQGRPEGGGLRWMALAFKKPRRPFGIKAWQSLPPGFTWYLDIPSPPASAATGVARLPTDVFREATRITQYHPSFAEAVSACALAASKAPCH